MLKKHLPFWNGCSKIMSVRNGWVWRSLVACLNGVQEVAGSIPVTQTRKNRLSVRDKVVFVVLGKRLKGVKNGHKFGA